MPRLATPLLTTVAALLAAPAGAQISASPTSLTATLGPGGTETQTLTVTNTGPAPVTFTAERGTAMVTVGGPDAHGYTWTDSDQPGGPVYQWTDVRATGTQHTLSSVGDVWVALPFAFPFYGATYDSVKVHADGLISFLPTYQGSTSNNRPIPYWDNPDLFIAGFWDDLDPSRVGGVYTGIDARGRFVVQYHGVGLAGSSAPAARYTFQIVLDSAGTIVIQYGPMDGPTNSATVGIENATSVYGGSTTGLEVAYNEPYVRDGLAVRIAEGDPWFTPVGGGTLQAGASAEVAVTFDAHDLAAGSLASSLVIAGGASSLSVPVALTVLAEPGVAVSVGAIDFGAAYIGAAGADSVVVSNVGSAPLTLASVSTDGPPFTAAMSGSPLLAPGERRVVAVAFTPTAAGPFAGTLTLITDDPDTPSATVALTGEGLLAPDVSVTPGVITAALPAGASITETLTIANGGASELTFDLGLRSGPGGVLDSLYYDFGGMTAGTTGWTPWQPLAVANRFTADGPFHLTDIRAFLRIERDPTVRFEVYGGATFGDPTSGPLLWSRDVAIPHGPAAMYQVPLDTTLTFADGEDFYLVIWTQGEFAPFGTHYSNGGRSYRRTYQGPTWHYETGSATYVIRALSTLDGAFALAPRSGTVPAGGSVDVAVTIGGPALVGGTHMTSLLVASNDPDTPEVVVPITLNVTGMPMIAVTADSLDFGEVYLGATRTQRFRVRNLGSGPLTISDIASSNPAFTVAPDGPITVGAGASDTLSVTFAPVAAGTHTGTVTISSDAPNAPALSVAVAGDGVDFPSIAASPDSVFVALLAGDSTSVTLAVTNNGAGPLAYAFEGFTGDAPAAEPDSFGYTWTDSDRPGGPAFHWVDISQTGTPLSLGDDTWADVDLPFLFPFYGDEKMAVRIASNGYLTFGNQRGDIWDNRPIPHNWPPNDLIAVLWDEIDPTNGAVYYGTDAEDRFIVQYTDVALHSSPTWLATFQVLLDRGGNILFQYLDVEGPWGSTVGIENADATDGLEISYNAFPRYVRDSLAVRIDAPTPWLTAASPASGTIAAGQSAQMTFSVDADSLEQGAYPASLRIASNDAARPLVHVPMMLEVSGTLTLQLRAGWNLVSWNVEPENAAVEAVLESILDRVQAVETYEGGDRRSYVPGRPGNTISALMPTYGYWIRLSAPAALVIEGTPVDRQSELPLAGGANAVSYLPWHASGVEHALGSVMDVTASAAGFAGTGVTYVPGVPQAFHVLDRMAPKAGYILRTTAPATLVYPVAPGGAAPGDGTRPTLEDRIRAEREAAVTPTMAWLDVWGEGLTVGGAPLSVGTRVTAFDPDGRPVGAFDVEAEGRVGLMAIYGDDPYTAPKDGAVPGEMIVLRVGDDALAQFPWGAAGDVLDLRTVVAAGDGGPAGLPAAFALEGNAPNPFATATTVRYALPSAARVRLTVYDLLGREVAVLVDADIAAGRHAVEWDGGGVASGTYVVTMSAGDFRGSHRLTLTR